VNKGLVGAQNRTPEVAEGIGPRSGRGVSGGPPILRLALRSVAGASARTGAFSSRGERVYPRSADGPRQPAERGTRLRCGTTVPSLGECVVSRAEHLIDKEGDDRYDEAQRAEGVLARVRQEVGEAPAERVGVHKSAERDVDPGSEAIDRESLACDEGDLPFHVAGQRRRRLLSPLSARRSAVPSAGILSIDETAPGGHRCTSPALKRGARRFDAAQTSSRFL